VGGSHGRLPQSYWFCEVQVSRVVERSLIGSSPWQGTSTFFTSSIIAFSRKRHLHRTLLAWLLLFQNSRVCWKECISKTLRVLNLPWKTFWQTSLFRILTVYNNDRSSGNVKNWSEIKFYLQLLNRFLKNYPQNLFAHLSRLTTASLSFNVHHLRPWLLWLQISIYGAHVMEPIVTDLGDGN
jgi:hypothetical protein